MILLLNFLEFGKLSITQFILFYYYTSSPSQPLEITSHATDNCNIIIYSVNVISY